MSPARFIFTPKSNIVHPSRTLSHPSIIRLAVGWNIITKNWQMRGHDCARDTSRGGKWSILWPLHGKTQTTRCSSSLSKKRVKMAAWAASISCLSETIMYLTHIMHVSVNLFFACWNWIGMIRELSEILRILMLKRINANPIEKLLWVSEHRSTCWLWQTFFLCTNYAFWFRHSWYFQ